MCPKHACRKASTTCCLQTSIPIVRIEWQPNFDKHLVLSLEFDIILLLMRKENANLTKVQTVQGRLPRCSLVTRKVVLGLCFDREYGNATTNLRVGKGFGGASWRIITDSSNH